MNEQREAKVAIARLVTELIEDGASLAIDSGSTSAFIAQALRVRKELSVVTNSAYAASTLSMVPGNKVSMAGTQLREQDGAAFDRSAFDVIERMQVQYVILSASAASENNGFLVYEQAEADIANAMLKSAARAIMAVDHSKFIPMSKKPMFRQPDLRVDDYLVTDCAPPSEFNKLISNLIVKTP